MIDNNKILTEENKKEGFSIYIENNLLNLYFSGRKVAIFEYNDLSYQKIRCFIGLGWLVNINYVNISNRISGEVENFIIDRFCRICGKNCKKLCKVAQIMYEQLFYQNWMEYVQTN